MNTIEYLYKCGQIVTNPQQLPPDQMIKSSFEMTELVIPPHTFNEDTDQCLICMRMLSNPVECGKCKARFCSRCAKSWKEVKRMCPKKCSKRWQIKRIKKLEYKLRCPYGGCTTESSPEDFAKHIKACLNKPLDVREEELKEKFLCQERHPLQYEPKITDVIKCSCGQLSRCFCWICIKDEEEENQQPIGYCCKCRPPPGISKKHCPIGHKLQKTHGALFTGLIAIFCDCCNRQLMHNEGCFNDRKCHFCVCYECYDSLPQQAETIASRISPMNQPVFVIQGLEYEDLSAEYIPGPN